MEKIWQKREAETSRAFHAFVTYRNLPAFSRTLERTCQLLDKKWPQYHSQLKKWSSQHEWVKRAAAWDGYKDKQTEAERLEDWKNFQENILKYAKGLLMKGARRMQNIPDDEIPAMALSKWAIDALKLFRDIRGKPSEIIEQKHTVEVQLSLTEERLELEEKLKTLLNYNAAPNLADDEMIAAR